MSKILIKPKANSKKFFTDAKMYQGVMRRNADGSESKEEPKELGAYKKERFIGSRQITRIAWSDSLKQYKVGDISNEDLNKIVAACKFRDSDNKLITEADRTVYDDPFFQHRQLKIHKEEGEVELDDSNPIHKLIILSMENRSTYNSGKISNPVMSTRTKYIMSSQEDINTNVSKEVDTWIEIGQLLGGLDATKMLKIATAFNLGVSSDSDQTIVKNALASVLKDGNNIVKGTTETYNQKFKRLATGDSEDLQLEYMITLATRKGYLRKKKQQGWLFNGKPVGTTDAAVVVHFKDPGNQDDYFELETLIGDTNKNSTQKSRSKTKSSE